VDIAAYNENRLFIFVARCIGKRVIDTEIADRGILVVWR